MPERAVVTYRDALLHRAELAEHGAQCELDKAAARTALEANAPEAEAGSDEP